MGLKPPLEADEIDRLVDWLELSAILDESRTALFESVIGVFEIAQDVEAENVGDEDARTEGIIGELTEEVFRRRQALGDEVYPFRTSDNGERLCWQIDGNIGRKSYNISLIINHSWSTGKLEGPERLTDSELSRGRNVFEVLAAFAAIGFAVGPAFLIGTNRRGAEALLERVRTVCAIAGEGVARRDPPDEAPPNANDDGVDVIAVAVEQDGPPARSFVFGQSAAGADWVKKSVRAEVENFLETWFEHRPINTESVIFVPAAPNHLVKRRESRRLGHILDRLRLPKYVSEGAAMIEADDTLIHFVENLNLPQEWLHEYYTRVGVGAAR